MPVPGASRRLQVRAADGLCTYCAHTAIRLRGRYASTPPTGLCTYATDRERAVLTGAWRAQ
eukprot:2720810-Rhodomonas_salina.2